MKKTGAFIMLMVLLILTGGRAMSAEGTPDCVGDGGGSGGGDCETGDIGGGGGNVTTIVKEYHAEEGVYYVTVDNCGNTLSKKFVPKVQHILRQVYTGGIGSAGGGYGLGMGGGTAGDNNGGDSGGGDSHKTMASENTVEKKSRSLDACFATKTCQGCNTRGSKNDAEDSGDVEEDKRKEVKKTETNYNCTTGASRIDFLDGELGQSLRVIDSASNHLNGLSIWLQYKSLTNIPEEFQHVDNHWFPSIGGFISKTKADGNLLFVDNHGRRVIFEATDATGTTYLPVGQNRPALLLTHENKYSLSFENGKTIVFSSFNDAGIARCEQITYKGANTINMVYNGNNRISEVRDSYGAVTTFTYDASNRITEINNPDNTKRVLGYNAEGKLSSYQFAEGIVVTFEYDEKGQMVKKTFPGDVVVTYSYNNDGEVVGYTKGSDHSETVARKSNTLTEITDSLGHIEKIYNIDGYEDLWIKKIDALGRIRERLVDAKFRTIWQSDPCGCGNGTSFTYDENNNVISESDNMGYTQNYVYDHRNNVIAKQNKMGGTDTYTYDSNNNMLSWTTKNNSTTKWSYNERNFVIKITDPRGYETVNTYNAAGNLTSTTYPDGGVVRYTRDVLGNIKQLIDKNGNLTSYEYDYLQRIIQKVGPVNDRNGDGTVDDADLAIAYNAGNYVSTEYDMHGNIIKTRSRNGSTVICEYDALDNPTKITWPDGVVTRNWYDGNGNLIKSIDRNGIYTFYQYDAADQLVKEYDDTGTTAGSIDSEDGYVQYTYNERGQIIFTRDKMGNVSERVYDDGGRMVKEIDAMGGSMQYGYTQLGQVKNIIDRLGNSTFSGVFDLYGTAYGTYDACGNLLAYGFDNNQNITSMFLKQSIFSQNNPHINALSLWYTPQVISPNYYSAGLKITKDYDSMSRVVREYTGDNEDEQRNCTSFTYDKGGYLTKVVQDADGQNLTTTITYNEHGALLTKTTPDGMVISYVYDVMGNTLSVTQTAGAQQLVTTYEYDILNRMVKKTSPDGIVTSYIYDNNGNTIKVIQDAEGAGSLKIVTTNTYDSLGRIVSTTVDSGQATSRTSTFSYDRNGNLLTQTDPTGKTATFTYDALNRRITASDAMGNTTHTVYDANSNVIEQIDANGRSTFTVYDALNRVIKQMNEMQQTVEYAHDWCGNILAMKDANEKVSSWVYNYRKQPVKLTYPNGNVEQYAYNRLGQLTLKTKPDGTAINYTYDNGGRPLTVGDTAYTYDTMGRVLSESSPGGNVSYAYDNYGRLTSTTDSNTGKTVAYTYNRLGARATMTVDSAQVTYGYDRLLNLTAVQRTGEAAPASYAYDLAGRRTALTTPNGVTTTYAYDNAGRLTGVQSLNAAQQVVSAFGYTLDPTGNRTAMNVNLGGTVNAINYQFDAAYRLIRETRKDANNVTLFDEQLTYDAVGNRLGKVTWQTGGTNVSTANTYNNANQLVSSVTGGVTTAYTYDANGNTVSIVEPGKTVTMTYDWLNRQTSWSDGTNTETQTYRGASWKRASTSVNGTQVKYLYDGDNVLSDYDSNNALTAFYVTPFLDQNISLTNGSGTSYYYTQDGLGSVRSLTNSAGAIVNKYDYTAFGEAYAGNTVEQLANRYTYTGREKSSLASAGAPMYYRWRSYSPQIGRFLWRDPIGYEDGVNIYAYVGNRSNKLNDAYGLSELSDIDSTSAKGYWLNKFDEAFDSGKFDEAAKYLRNAEGLDEKPGSGVNEYYLDQIENAKNMHELVKAGNNAGHAESEAAYQFSYFKPTQKDCCLDRTAAIQKCMNNISYTAAVRAAKQGAWGVVNLGIGVVSVALSGGSTMALKLAGTVVGSADGLLGLGSIIDAGKTYGAVLEAQKKYCTCNNYN